MPKTDHDILIELATDMKYVKEFVTKNTSAITTVNKKVLELEDWQQDIDSKSKMFFGIATFIGAFVTFVGNKLWDYFSQKG